MIRGKSRKELRSNPILLLIFCLFVLAGASASEENEEEFTLLTGQPLKLTGYTQVRYTYSDEDTDGFRIRRARFGLMGDILKHINYKLQIDAAKSPVLLDGRVEISVIPYARVSFGQFKVPFSLENLTSSSDLDTINRSQTVENLCPGRDIDSQGRDIGLTFSGEFSWIEYSFGVFNGSGINKKDHNEQKDKVCRFVFHPFSFFTIGISHYQGKYNRPSGGPHVERDRTGVDLSFCQGRISVKGEYISAKDDRTDRYGWYIQGGFYLIPGKIQTIVKYDSYDENMDVRGDRSDVITIGLNWFFSKKTKFQINYEHHKEGSDKASRNVILAQFQAGF